MAPTLHEEIMSRDSLINIGYELASMCVRFIDSIKYARMYYLACTFLNMYEEIYKIK